MFAFFSRKNRKFWPGHRELEIPIFMTKEKRLRMMLNPSKDLYFQLKLQRKFLEVKTHSCHLTWHSRQWLVIMINDINVSIMV